MTSAYTVYEFYLEPADLKGKPHTVKVERAAVKDVFNSRIKHTEPKIVLKFANRLKVMPLNKTQAEAMITVAQSDLIEKWVNVEIVITPARTAKAQDTITITAVEGASATPKQPAGPAPAEAAEKF